MISLNEIKRFFVGLKGNQVIDGIKRFKQFPYTPFAAPEENYHVVNKKFLEDTVTSISLHGLADVSVSTPADNDVLTYVSARNQWEPAVGGGGGAMTSISLLDGDYHEDTDANSPTRGDLIKANATPKWDVLAIGLAAEFLKSDGTDPAWASVGWTDISGAAAVSTWISSVSTSLSSNVESISTNTEYIISVSNAASTKISGSLSTWISSVSTSLSSNVGSISTNTEYIASVSNYFSTYISVSTIFFGDESTSGTWGFAPHSTDLKVFRIEGGVVVEKSRFIP